MKFAQKLTLSALVLLSFLLALTGTQLVRRNFRASLAAQAQSAEQSHSLLVRQAERELLEEPELQTAVYRFSDGARSGGALFAVYQNGNVAASQLPADLPVAQRDAAAAEPGRQSICRAAGGAHYLLTATRLPVAGNAVTLLSAFDVEPLYQARRGQLGALAATSAVTLLAAALLLRFWAARLTRPLAQLDRAAHLLAQGDYSQRVALATEDEVGHLAQSFNAMGEAISQNVCALRREVQNREDFVAAFTHELKTPMTSMMGYAALLRQKDQPAQMVHEASDFIYQETKRLENLSGSLLALLGLQQAPPALEPLALDEIFGGVERRLPAGGPTVRFSPCGLAVMGERTLLEILVENLVSNARKACRERGSVTVFAKEEGPVCLLTVADTGCGIPPKDLPRVTEPFYMADKSRARAENGSGMGLALCARIAQACGGALTIESQEGRGTTVTVSLPLAGEEDV